MTGWALFFTVLGVATAGAIPLRIVEWIERK